MTAQSAPTEEEVKKALESALDKLKEKDRYLLENDVNKRSIALRLAMYL